MARDERQSLGSTGYRHLGDDYGWQKKSGEQEVFHGGRWDEILGGLFRCRVLLASMFNLRSAFGERGACITSEHPLGTIDSTTHPGSKAGSGPFMQSVISLETSH